METKPQERRKTQDGTNYHTDREDPPAAKIGGKSGTLDNTGRPQPGGPTLVI